MKSLLAMMAVLVFNNAFATDLDHTVSGSTVEDVLGKSDTPSNNPYIINGESEDHVLKAKPQGSDIHFSAQPELNTTINEKRNLSETGYTLPGTFEKQESYIELDKKKMAKEFRKHSEGGINITFIKNDFDYMSTNDVINRTISTGAGSLKGGSLFVRHDDYIFKTTALNGHWSAGGGLGFSTGRGFFTGDGSRSEAKFNLWEVPLDLGIGLEIPVFSVVKLVGTVGPSYLALIQNRSDYERGETGKRKVQHSPGYFASAQFKINMSTFSDQTAYELFTESQITNVYMNLEARYHNYSKFRGEDIEISGTSFGIGFTFEYL